MKMRQTAVALAFLNALLLAPGGVRATPSDLDGDPFTGVAVVGSSPEGAEFIGTMDVEDFDSRDGRLVAVGTLSGQVTQTNGSVSDPVSVVNEVPVEVPVGAVVATCDRFSLTFGPVPLAVKAPMVQVTPIRIDGADQAGAGPTTPAHLCALASQFRGATAPSLQAGVLDAVMHAFD